MDDTQTDREVFVAVCHVIGIDPDGPMAPDIDRLAASPDPFDVKAARFRQQLLTRCEGRCAVRR